MTITLNGAFTPQKLYSNLYALLSTWPAPEYMRPLTILYIPHLGAQPRHLEKYLQLYVDFYKSHRPRPLHVLWQIPTNSDFLLPSKSVSGAMRNLRLIDEVLDPDDKVLVHSASIGAFSHAAHLTVDKEQRLDILRRRIVGQLFDSVVYGGPAEDGIPKMVDGLTQFVANPLLKKVLKSGANVYLNRSVRRRQMDGAIRDFIHEAPSVPTLTFTSANDPLADAELIQSHVINKWTVRNSQVIHHCFEDSPHARHLQTHPEIYKALFREYLMMVQPTLEEYDAELLSEDEEEKEVD